VLVEDMAGAVLATISQAIGVCTNNVAEYRALLAGLEKAKELGAAHVEVVSDSELLVKQMLGAYRVKNVGLQPLHAQAGRLSSQFASFQIIHMGRDRNARADGLVNRALDEQERASL
jgi:ribonuclease HI